MNHNLLIQETPVKVHVDYSTRITKDILESVFGIKTQLSEKESLWSAPVYLDEETCVLVEPVATELSNLTELEKKVDRLHKFVLSPNRLATATFVTHTGDTFSNTTITGADDYTTEQLIALYLNCGRNNLPTLGDE